MGWTNVNFNSDLYTHTAHTVKQNFVWIFDFNDHCQNVVFFALLSNKSLIFIKFSIYMEHFIISMRFDTIFVWVCGYFQCMCRTNVYNSKMVVNVLSLDSNLFWQINRLLIWFVEIVDPMHNKKNHIDWFNSVLFVI